SHHGVGRTGAFTLCRDGNQRTADPARDGDLARDFARVVSTQVHEVRRLVDRRMEGDVTDQGAGEVLVLLSSQTDEGIRASKAICQVAPTRHLRRAGPAGGSTSARLAPMPCRSL